MRFIVDNTCTEPERLGGKAGALAALRGRAVQIPPWFTVSPEAVAGPLPEHGRTPLELSDDARAELQSALATLCPDGAPVAVRSSASDEDGRFHSFAGQFASFLYIHPERVAEKVEAVWRSAFGANVVSYREQHNLGPLSAPPSVLVQRMVNAEFAGVAFGADPVSGDSSVAVVSAVHGLGTSLVSGESDADTYYIDESGVIVRRSIANKILAHHASAEGEEGVIGVAVDPARANAPALTDEQVCEVAALVCDVGSHFDHPQDIEWAFAEGQLYLLQSRPITALKESSAPSGVLNIWDNSNIVESYNGVTTPLTFSFASYVYDEVYRQFCKILRVPEARIESNALVFRNMLGLIQGRVYYNLLNWYRALALLPGFQSNRGFMEQMMGVKGALPVEVLDTHVLPEWHVRFWDRLCLARSAFALIGHHIRLKKTISDFYKRLDIALTQNAEGLKHLRANELATLYTDVEKQLLRRWDAPLINDFLAMIFFGLLGSLCEKWIGRKEVANDLLCDIGGTISVEPARRLRRLAKLAAGQQVLIEVLCDGTLSEIRSAMATFPEFREAFEAYVGEFGNRCLEELKLESPTLHDDPLPLLRSAGIMGRRGAEAPEARGTMRASGEARVKEVLGSFGLRRYWFGFVLRNARGRVRDRENLRFERTRVFGFVRTIFLTIGKRFQEVGVLDDRQDIFYLECNEIFGFIEGRATTLALRQLVAVRKEEFNAYRAAPQPSSRFETHGIVGAAHATRQETATEYTLAGDECQGLGCCAGIVSGPARLITDPRNECLQPGDILVAKSTDPGWILHFAAAAGILVERGSLLSHSAIVSRELGIPCVVSILGLTKWLKDGDHVEINGATGLVRRIVGKDRTEGDA